MSDYWQSTKSPPLMLFNKSYHTPEREQFLRDNAGIDAALLANDLQLSIDAVQAYQRVLGLRAINANRYKRKSNGKSKT